MEEDGGEPKMRNGHVMGMSPTSQPMLHFTDETKSRRTIEESVIACVKEYGKGVGDQSDGSHAQDGRPKWIEDDLVAAVHACLWVCKLLNITAMKI